MLPLCLVISFVSENFFLFAYGVVMWPIDTSIFSGNKSESGSDS